MYLDPQHCFLLTVMRLSWLVTIKVNYKAQTNQKKLCNTACMVRYRNVLLKNSFAKKNI